MWIVGVGAIGSVIAGKLEAGGTVLIDSWQTHVDAIRESGLTVDYPEGTVTAKLPAYHLDEIDTIEGSPEVILLAVKSNATVETLTRLSGRMLERTIVVSLQNGINEDSIADAVGQDRTIGAAVMYGGELASPGHAFPHPGPRHLVIGELDGSLTERVAALAARLSPSVEVEVTEDIWAILWTKLVVNSEMNAVAAVTGFRGDEIAADPAARRFALSLARECVAVAVAIGLDLDYSVLDGTADDYLDSFDSDRMRAVERRFVERWSRLPVKPSMLQDLEKGRPTEIDFFNGYIVKKARALGIAVPANEAIVRMVKSAEADGWSPRPEALAGVPPEPANA